MKWLITGGLGFVGVNLVGSLVALGHECRLLDNFSTGSEEDLGRMLDGEGLRDQAGTRLEIVSGDVRDADCVSESAAGCQAIVHLAAHTNVIDSVELPTHCFETNAMGTLNVLEAARQNGIQSVIIASSNAAAGEVTPPVHEDVVPHPISPYGASKLAGEALASGYAGAYGLRAISLRFANVYGPYSLHKGSVVALFMKRLLKGEPLVLYDGGRPTRDYIHVSDIVQAIEKAAERGTPGQVYQIATGVETSTSQLVDVLRKATGRDIVTQDAPARAGEISRNFSDISKARTELAFEPSVELREGVAALWPWYQAHFGSISA